MSALEMQTLFTNTVVRTVGNKLTKFHGMYLA